MHQPNRRRALVAAVLANAAPAVAATVDWLPTATSPASFSDPANWSTGTAPTSADIARFDAGSGHTVALTTDTTTDQLLVANDALTLDLAGRTYTLANTSTSAPSLQLGSSTASALTLTTSATTGLLKANVVNLSPASTDVSSLSLNGPTSLAATPSANFMIGLSGRATVDLTGGASASAGNTYVSYHTGSSASLILDGTGTRWSSVKVFAGLAGTGSITVTNGASLSAATDLVLASTSTSVGAVTVRGAASTLSANTIYVGGNSSTGGGAGTLNVESGTVTANALILWSAKTSALNLSGGTLRLGSLAAKVDPSRFHWTGGTLELTSSSFAVSPTPFPGTMNSLFPELSNPNFNPGPALNLAPGMSLKLSGPGQYLAIDNGGILSATGASISVASRIFVGYAGSGTLALDNSASLTSGLAIIGDMYPAAQPPFPSSFVSLDHGSSWTVDGLNVGYDGGASLSIRGGSSVSAANSTVSRGTVTVSGPGSAWRTAGTLTVGTSAGPGDVTLTDAATVTSAEAVVNSGQGSVTLRGPASSWTNSGTLAIAQPPSNFGAVGTVSVAEGANLITQFIRIATSASRSASAPYSGTLALSSGGKLSVSDSFYLGRNNPAATSTATATLTDASATVANRLQLYVSPNTSLSLTRSTLTIGAPAAPGTLDNAASVSLADHSTLTLHGTLANVGTVSLSADSLLLWDPVSVTAPLSTLRTQLATDHILPSPTTPATYRPAYTVSGEPTTPTSLTITLALAGDTNLDGRINADDYALLDRAFAKSATDACWTDGDFDYDGIVTSADYLLIDTVFSQAQGLSPGFLSVRESQFGPAYVADLLASVPEPSSTACLFAALLPLARRRR